MSALADFLRVLLDEGRVVLRELPGPGKARDAAAAELLRRAYGTHRLAWPPVSWCARPAGSWSAMINRQKCSTSAW
jgi:hypothetical protein